MLYLKSEIKNNLSIFHLLKTKVVINYITL